MLILTTPNIEGHKIIEYYGLVTGESLLGANVYKDLFQELEMWLEEELLLMKNSLKVPEYCNQQYNRKSRKRRCKCNYWNSY